MATKALPTCIRILACTTYKEKKKNNIQENGGGGDAIGLFHSMKPISGK